MKHAGAAALDMLDPLLAEIRKREGLKEPRPGVFYRKGRAFLHFHEDAAGLFADLRIAADWKRYPVSRPDDRARLLAAIDRSLVRPD